MYSLISRRIIAFSSSNKNSASARLNSVFPTPVGPRKINEPIGLFSSCNPARARRTAFETARIAECWPMTRSCKRSSIFTNFSRSPSFKRETGIPVHFATTSAISSSVTSSRRSRSRGAPPRKVAAAPPPLKVAAAPPPLKVAAAPPPLKVEAAPPPLKVEAAPPPLKVAAAPPPLKVEAAPPPPSSLK